MKAKTIAAACTALLGCTHEELAPVEMPGALPQGTLELPTTVWPDNPRAQVSPDSAHAYRLDAVAGAKVALSLSSPSDELVAALYVSGPSGVVASAAGVDIAIDVVLPEAGTYQLVVASVEGAGAYRLDAECLREPCQPPGMTFEATRIAQADIREEDGPLLDAIGNFLFDHVYRLSEGLGNAWEGGAGRPNMRLVHDGPKGGPDGQSCVSCHFVGGRYGAGRVSENIFQAGNGRTTRSALERNPPPLRGLGLREALAQQISRQLREQADASRSERDPQPHELCVRSLDGQVCFGTALRGVASAQGIDADLVVKPFGWKGREATLRDFVRGGFRVHFGLQAEDKIAKYCDNPEPTSVETARFEATWGVPAPRCEDPDRDAVVEEITGGQLSAMALHLMQLDAPPPAPADEEGRALLAKARCTDCHVRGFALSRPENLGAEIGVVPELPQLHAIELWSDFRRHDLGREHADSKSFVNAPAADIRGRQFMTPPLWDLAASAPYLHDGSAPTLLDAILAHGAEGEDSVRAFSALSEDEQATLLSFLASLGS